MQSQQDLFAWVTSELELERTALQIRHERIIQGLRSHMDGSGVSKNGHPQDIADAALTGADSIPIEAAGKANDAAGQMAEEAQESETPSSPTQSASSALKQRKSTLGSVMEQEQSYPLDPAWIVRSSQFELFFAAVIVSNSLVMAVQAIYDGINVGNKIGYAGFESTAEEYMPGASDAFGVLEMIFGVLFTIEVVLKVVGLKIRFLYSLWNWFDTFLVAVWIVDSVLRSFPLDTNLLRLVRLARLMRLVKIARAVQGFDSLVVMTTALQGSLFALVWVFVLLCCIQMLFALLLGQLLTIYIDTDPNLDTETRWELFKYFGTFPRATLTMFELTLGNFAPVARMLQEHVSQFMVVFNLLHKVTFGFACVGVVNGVFMQETLKVAQNDDSMMMRTVQNRKRQHAKKMHDFFQYADNSGDGSVTKDEWTHVLSNEKAQDWFAGHGLTVQDADLLFDLLETSGDGSLTSEELARGVSKLAGPSKSFDVLAAQREQKLVNESNRQLISDFSARLHALQGDQLRLGQVLQVQQAEEQPCASQSDGLKYEVMKLREELRGYNDGRVPRAVKSKTPLYQEASDFVRGI